MEKYKLQHSVKCRQSNERKNCFKKMRLPIFPAIRPRGYLISWGFLFPIAHHEIPTLADNHKMACTREIRVTFVLARPSFRKRISTLAPQIIRPRRLFSSVNCTRDRTSRLSFYAWGGEEIPLLLIYTGTHLFNFPYLDLALYTSHDFVVIYYWKSIAL